MNSTDRRLKIFDILQKKESIEVGELSALFDVSPMTIRRDLAIFEKQGLLTTTYGGAYLNNAAVPSVSVLPSASQDEDAVRGIGLAAAKLLKSGDRIFLDAGEVAGSLIYGLSGMRLTVMTNSLSAANMLRTFANLRLVMMPGDYREELRGFLSSATIAFIRNYNFDFAFIDGACLDPNAGLTARNETEAQFKATAIDCANCSVVMVKSENIGQIEFAQAGPLRKITYAITDENVLPQQVSALEKRGISVIVGSQAE